MEESRDRDLQVNDWQKFILNDDRFDGQILKSIQWKLFPTGLCKINLVGSKNGRRMDDHHVIYLVDAIIKLNIQLTDLTLSCQAITDVGFEEVCRLLKPGLCSNKTENSSKLRVLNMEGNEITGTCFLSSNICSEYECSLLVLNISCNPLSSNGRSALTESIVSNKILQQLSVNCCGFDLSDTISLLTSMQKNHSITTLCMDRPLIGSNVGDCLSDHLSRLISHSKCLTSVSFRHSAVSDFGSNLIASSLMQKTHMVYINLEANKIGNIGAEALATYFLLRPTSSVQFIELSNNIIGNDGAIALSEALKVNVSLRHLHLRNNKIESLGLTSIAQSLEENNTLEKISLFGNQFSNNNGHQFSELIRTRLPVSRLKIDLDVYTVDDQHMIAEVLI